MRGVTKLSELKEGNRALVINVCSNDSMRRRLQDLGFISGTLVSCVLKSPLGDPAAYLVRGAVIALRCEDSSCVQIEYCEV